VSGSEAERECERCAAERHLLHQIRVFALVLEMSVHECDVAPAEIEPQKRLELMKFPAVAAI
jgi:hypothetical protein